MRQSEAISPGRISKAVDGFQFKFTHRRKET